jgi:small subunit ribosomal protein S2
LSELTFNDAVNQGIISQRAAEYLARKKQKEVFGAIGATVRDGYLPHTLLSNPPTAREVTLEQLLASQAHLGHTTSIWNPANARYIYGIRDGIHIISLEETAAHLRRAAKVVQAVAERAGLILFVGTRAAHTRAVVRAAELANACHLFERWTPGSLTNGLQVLRANEVKVVDQLDRELLGFEDQMWERPALKPDLVVCFNPLENRILLHECALNTIPTIGVVDTNVNPTWVTYPIPANDDR